MTYKHITTGNNLRMIEELQKKVIDLDDRVAELSDIVNVLIGRIALLENQQSK